MSSDLLRRQAATEATKHKYWNRAFDWKDGVTCVHLARFHLRQMGHRPEPMPRVRSLVGAKRALAERGCANVVQLLDRQATLTRIAPAFMTMGDLAAVASEDGLGSIFICMGPQKLMGWHDAGADFGITGMCNVTIPFDVLDGAWSL